MALPFHNADTIDEAVTTTIMRDLSAMFKKLKIVCFPRGEPDALHEWDLWGPLLLCLCLSITMSITGDHNQTIAVFTWFFGMFWAGAGLTTVNAKLLGAKLSFFQSVCVLGYSMFPILAAAIISGFVDSIIIRGVCVLACCVWSVLVSRGFLIGANIESRLLLALYPIGLFYFTISWMVFALKFVDFQTSEV